MRRIRHYALVLIAAFMSSLLVLHVLGGYRNQGTKDASVGQIRPFVVPEVIKDMSGRINDELARIKRQEQQDMSLSATDEGALDGDKEEYPDIAQDTANDPDVNIKHIKEMVELNPDMTRIRDRMVARRETLHEACAKRGMRKLDLQNKADLRDVLDHRGNLDTMMWSDTLTFITSVIHKCGSDNWKQFMGSLVDSGTIQENHNLKQLMSALRGKPDEIRYKLENYLKIVTVRHPLIRFVSVYRDKFVEHTDKFRKDIPAKIKRSAGGSAGRVTFPAFANFVTTKGMSTADPHWTPQHIRTRPCEHDFDLIVKLETSVEDFDFIYGILGLDGPTMLPEYTDRHQVSNNETLIIDHYNQLSEDAFQLVLKVYEVDFDLFGYYRPRSIADAKRIFEDFA